MVAERFKVLIIKVGALGDVLRTTSILTGLKKKHPNLWVCWITSVKAEALLRGNPLIDEICFAESLSIAQMEKTSFDLVVSLDDEKACCRIASAVKKEYLTGAYLNEQGKRSYTRDSRQWFDMGLISRFNQRDR